MVNHSKAHVWTVSRAFDISAGETFQQRVTRSYFQWSISWSTEQWSVKRKSHTDCLFFPLIIARAEHFEESKSPYVAPLMTSICPAVLGRLSAFLLVCDRSLTRPTVSSPHLRQHQDDCVQTTRSQLDAEGGEGAFSTFSCRTFRYSLARAFPSPRLLGRCTLRQNNEIWQDPFSGTQLNLRPASAVCSCLREVLSALTIWPWTCAKLLSSSCIKH